MNKIITRGILIGALMLSIAAGKCFIYSIDIS